MEPKYDGLLTLPLDEFIAMDSHALAELAVLFALRDFVMEHPGCVRARGKKVTFSDSYRRFVITLCGPDHAGSRLSMAEMAEITKIPVKTLEQWLGTR